MSDLIVHGGTPLRGRLVPSANKNAVLPILCGTLLARESQPATDAQAGGAAAEAAEGGWRLVLTDAKTESALDSRFDEARELRLVPVIDFKGRRRKSAPDEERAAAPAADASMNGEQDR